MNINSILGLACHAVASSFSTSEPSDPVRKIHLKIFSQVGFLTVVTFSSLSCEMVVCLLQLVNPIITEGN